MPVFRMNNQLAYYAHVPKCAGSSVETYLKDRFGTLGLVDTKYLLQPPHQRWTRSSPQHVDWQTLMRLIPAEYFSSVFAVVRHPVSRIVSAYHFQTHVEKTAPVDTPFQDWLHALLEAREQDPFVVDNHIRPQAEFMPESCDVFYLEHGLDALIPYFDGLTGDKNGPRAMSRTNTRTKDTEKASLPVLSDHDLDLISQVYAVDFERFGYTIGEKMPKADAPGLSAEFQAENARAKQRADQPLNRLASRIKRKLIR